MGLAIALGGDQMNKMVKTNLGLACALMGTFVATMALTVLVRRVDSVYRATCRDAPPPVLEVWESATRARERLLWLFAAMTLGMSVAVWLAPSA